MAYPKESNPPNPPPPRQNALKAIPCYSAVSSPSGQKSIYVPSRPRRFCNLIINSLGYRGGGVADMSDYGIYNRKEMLAGPYAPHGVKRPK